MTRLESLEQCLDAVLSGTEERIIHHGAFCLDDAVNVDLAYAGSLDAAKALHDAVLPGLAPVIDVIANEVELYKGFDDEWEYLFSVKSDNLARAWLIAILKALIAEERG